MNSEMAKGSSNITTNFKLTFRTIVISVTLATSISANGNAQSDTSAHNSQIKSKYARAEYHQDPNAPDGIAFYGFLKKITYFSTISREDAIHAIVDSFEFEHDKVGTSAAESLYDYFEVTYENLDADLSEMEAKTMCPPARQFRTKKQIVDSFNKVDDKTEFISEKYYRKMKKDLTIEEFDRLVIYLQRFKAGMHYVKTDFARQYEEVPVDRLVEFVETTCNKMGV